MTAFFSGAPSPGTQWFSVATGNGPFDGKTNWGDSVLALSSDAARLVGDREQRIGQAPTHCAETYAAATVTLTATPAPGSGFVVWRGACIGNASCDVTMSAARTVTATFAAPRASGA